MDAVALNVNTVKNQVEALSRAQAGAYASGDDFNAQSRRAELLLLDYYIERFGGVTHSSLQHLMKTSYLAAPGAVVQQPDDLRLLVRLSAVETYLNEQGAPVKKTRPCAYVSAVSADESQASTLRGGNAKLGRFCYSDSQYGAYKIWPGSINSVELLYLRLPIYGFWGYTIDPVNIVENYDATNSVNYEWPDNDENNLVEILLYLRGIQTRQTDLAQWLAQREKTVPNAL